MMIFVILAYRIRYDTHIFITLSSDEGHNLLMIQLSRTRRNDPVMKNKFTKPLGHFDASEMPDVHASSEDIVLVASVEDMLKALPSHDARTIMFSYRCVSVGCWISYSGKPNLLTLVGTVFVSELS